MDSSFNIPILNLKTTTLTGYSLLITIFALLIMLVLFMRKKFKSYMAHRDKLIKMAEDYERKRECRSSLRVNK
jgi:hypothetical protein